MASKKRNLLGRLRALRNARKTPNNQETNGESSAALEKKLILTVKKPRWIPSSAQLAHLPRILGRTERVLFVIAVLVFVITAGILSGSLLRRSTTLLPRTGGTYTEALVGQPILINPLWADANPVDRDLTALIFSGLFRYDTQGTLVPDLAESFTIDEEQKIYTVTLASDLLWHDEVPLTAEDVVFTIRAIQTAGYGSTRALDFKEVSVEALDATTVQFTLSEPYTPFLHALTVGLIPAHLWGDVPPQTARLAQWNTQPVGAGPFRLENIKKTKQGSIHSYTLERNPLAHGAPANLARITIRFFPDYPSAVDALARGTADGFAFLPQELRGELERRRDLEFHPIILSQITALFLNQKQNAILTEPKVREALAHATPKDTLIRDAFGGSATSIDGPLGLRVAHATDELTTYTFDLERAAALLKENGWKFGEDASVRTFVPEDKNDKRFSKDTELAFTLTTVNIPEYVVAGELIRDAWKSIGVRVELATVTASDMIRSVLPERKFDILLHGLVTGADGDPHPFWHSSQATSPGANLSQYANRRVDGLLEEARGLQDEEEQNARYIEFQKIVTAELPAIFLFSPHYTYALHKDVQGVDFTQLGSPEHRFNGVRDWYVKTKRGF